MKVKINHKKIVDSPYSKQHKDAFIFEDLEAITQLGKELLNGNSSTYLISGYRGSGKTSVINRIEEDLESAIIVKMSLAKYETYNLLLRKLIRQLYFSFIKTSYYLSPKENVSDLSKSFTLLFERTFNEIIFSGSKEQKLERKKVFDVGIDLRKLLPIIFTIISTSNLLLQFLTIDWVFNAFFFISTLIWSLSTFNFTYTRSKSNVDSELISRKSLYDDEISEFQLLEILKKLKDKKLNVIVVFDELDKIDDLEKINTVINELKSLLLSGLAHFIVVSGQTLYYQFEKSFYKDDSVMFSLFSKTIHVQLFNTSTLKQYVLNLVEDNTMKDNDTLNNYIDSLILQSRRIPRRLSNIIRNLIVWENNEAYLEIDETPMQYEIDSKLCHLINAMIEYDLADFTSNKAEIDFYTSLLHLYVLKIKLQKGKKFKLHTIIKLVEEEAYDMTLYPQSYVLALEHLCKNMLDKFIEANLIKNQEIESENYYEWIEADSLISTNEPSEESAITESRFLEQFNELEQYVKDIYIDVFQVDTIQSTNKTLSEMLQELIDRNVYTKKWYTLKKFEEVFDLRNQIVQGREIKVEDLDKIIDSRISISRLKSELIEDYTYFISNNYLSERGYSVRKETRNDFDFIAMNNTTHLLFEAKYSSSALNARSVEDIFRKYENYNVISKSNNYYILFLYQPNGRKSYDSFYKRFYDKLNELYPQYKRNIYLFYTSEYRGDASTGRLENFIQKVLNEIEEYRNNLKTFLVGKWRNDWEIDNPNNMGSEILEITEHGEYLINNKKTFKIENFSYDDYTNSIVFLKVRLDDGTKLLNILAVQNNELFIGTEKNLSSELAYAIRYTKLV